MLLPALNTYADTSIINVYDANGNLVTGDGRYYEYNDANQLVRVRQGGDQAGPVIAEYFYDFSGQRVKKIENGVVTYYVGKHFEKQVGGTAEGNTGYYFGDGAERVAKKDPAGNVFYYHLDHLDGINAVTDTAGTVVSRTDYLPFGDLRAGSSGSEKYSYTGKEKDKTDLYYFEARYNSPEFKHFTQADVADPDYSDPQDLNRYAYVGNNPLSYVDYDGFKKKKKAKLSKREKWMIAHGVDPDHDKTSLKKAKKQLKAGKKYSVAQSKPTLAFADGSIQGFESLSLNSSMIAGGVGKSAITKARIQAALTQAAAYREEEYAWRQAEVNILEGTYKAIGALGSALTGDVRGAVGGMFDMSSTLANISGHSTVGKGFSLVSSGIELSGYLGTAKNYYKSLDGRTRQAKALFKENDLDNMSDLAKEMRQDAVALPFDLFQSLYD